MADFKQVAKTTEIPEGGAACFGVGAENIAIFEIDGAFHAIADECSHEDGPLSEGDIEGFEVECPWHMARFDVRTGKAMCEPACGDVKCYALRVVGDDIEVDLG